MSSTRQGHRTRVQTAGWGEPLTMVPVCTCGWVGQVVQEPYLTPDQMPDPPTGARARPAIRERCAALGHPRPEKYGTYDEAVVQGLVHRGYVPESEVVAARAAFDAAVTQTVREAAKFRAVAEATALANPDRTDYTFTQLLDDATARLANASYERHVWLTVPPPPVIEV